MSKEEALYHYLGQKGHAKLNCAQSVIAAFWQKAGLEKELVNHFATFGGGRAPSGDCGALYALTYIVGNTGCAVSIQECRQRFIEAAGSDRCRQIRNLRKLTCAGCVEKAADCLQEYLTKGRGAHV